MSSSGSGKGLAAENSADPSASCFDRLSMSLAILSVRIPSFASLSANKLIGVQEINDFLCRAISMDQCIELINIRTRQYAKRQNTWARGHMKNWSKLYSKNFSNLLKKSLKVVS